MVANRHPADYSPEKTQVLRSLAGLAGEVFNHNEWVVSARANSIRAERQWLAAELHDGLAHLLGAITQGLKLTRWVLGRSAEPASIAADLQEVLERSEEAHQELRLALGEIRNRAAEGDLDEAIAATLKAFSCRSGMQAELVEVPAQRLPLPPTTTLQILRIIQEALNKARKHSGGSQVWLRWTHVDGMHTFTIQGNGRVLNAAAVGHGFGMTIMSDRARRIGSELRVHGVPDSGCTVVLTVPDERERGRTGGAGSSAVG